MMNDTELVLSKQAEFIKFLKNKFVLIHNSNVFFRDFHYGILSYLLEHGRRVSYDRAEIIARELSAAFENAGLFKRIDHQSWLLNYPEFALPRAEKNQPKAVE